MRTKFPKEIEGASHFAESLEGDSPAAPLQTPLSSKFPVRFALEATLLPRHESPRMFLAVALPFPTPPRAPLISTATSRQVDRMKSSRFNLRSRVCLVFMIWFAGVRFVWPADEPRSLFVEGYAGRVSYSPAEDLTLHVSTTAAAFSVEIVRLGAKSESVWSSASVTGREHPVPEDASSHGCRWPAAINFSKLSRMGADQYSS